MKTGQGSGRFSGRRSGRNVELPGVYPTPGASSNGVDQMFGFCCIGYCRRAASEVRCRTLQSKTPLA
mgnify:CR=1 FL=1